MSLKGLIGGIRDPRRASSNDLSEAIRILWLSALERQDAAACIAALIAEENARTSKRYFWASFAIATAAALIAAVAL